MGDDGSGLTDCVGVCRGAFEIECFTGCEPTEEVGGREWEEEEEKKKRKKKKKDKVCVSGRAELKVKYGERGKVCRSATR